MSDENKAIVLSAFEALASHNFDPLDDLLAPDCVMHQCGFLEPIRGIEAIKRLPGGRLVTAREARLDSIVGEGDTVAIKWLTTGLHIDPEDPQESGKPVAFMCMTFLRVEGGKIQEIWNIQDMSTFWRQVSSP